MGGRGRDSASSEGRWAAKFSREELRDLFTLREDTLSDTHHLICCGRGPKGRGTALEGHVSSESSEQKVGIIYNLGLVSLSLQSCIMQMSVGEDSVGLGEWSYYPAPLHETSLSDQLLMGGAASHITFVFQSETPSGTSTLQE